MEGLNTKLFNDCVEHVNKIYNVKVQPPNGQKQMVVSYACRELVASLCFAYMENPSEEGFEQIVKKMMELFRPNCALNSVLVSNQMSYIGEYPAVIYMSVLLCAAHDNLLNTFDSISSLSEQRYHIQLSYSPQHVFQILQDITNMRGLEVYTDGTNTRFFPCRKSNDGYMVGLAMKWDGPDGPDGVDLQIFGYGGGQLMIRKDQRWSSEATELTSI